MKRPSIRPARTATALGAVTAVTAAASLSTFALSAPGASAAQQPPTIDCAQVKQAPILADDYNPQGRPIHYKPDRRGVYVPIIMVPDWSGRATHDASRTGDFSSKIDLGMSGPLPPLALPASVTTPPSATPTPTTRAQRKEAARKEAAAKAAATRPGATATPRATPAPTFVPPDGRASLIGQLQRIPGAVVYTFDYRDNAGRWVDDPGIGPALGDAIDCVADAMGQKVILVAKGIGGLAARYATAGPTDERSREDKVSTVIDYGSPQAGSIMAELLNTGIGKTASEPRMLLRLLLASCSAVRVQKLPLDAPCSYMPYLAKQMAALDGLALRTGSSQLAALRPFPPRVALHAFAGETLFTVPQLGWFGVRPFKTSNVALGDLVAQTSSTTIGALSQLRAACSVQVDAFGAPTQAAGLRFAEIAGAPVAPAAVTPGAPPAAVPGAPAPPGAPGGTPVAGAPTVPVPPPVVAPTTWYGTARPCFNGSLTRIQEFAVRLTEIIQTEIRNRQPINLSELEALPVPSLCGFPAGNLVGGVLPGIPEDQGRVALASTLHPDRSAELSVFGDITGDTVPDTVVVLECDTVDGPGSDTVAVYDSQGKLLGSVTLQNITDQVRNDVYEIIVKRGVVRMRWATGRDTDDPCCPTVDATTTFTYDPLQALIVPGPRVSSFNETLPASALVDAVKAGNRAKALKLASPEIVDVMIDADTNYGGLGGATCYGSTYRDKSWPPEAIEEYGDWPRPDGVEHGDRYCVIDLNGEPVALLGMKHLGFRQWQAVEFLIPTDSPFVDPDESDDGILPPVFGDDEPDTEPTEDPGSGPVFP